jgi:alpha-galactosidase/6-phospho-beta-glucosidase family protein
MPKVTLMGAGSAVFSHRLMVDILLIPGLDGGSLALVDIDPTRLELAHQLAALNQTHMAVHELVATSLLEGDREAALHALMLDPLTAAVCSLKEIHHLFDEMYQAECEFIRAF